MRTKQILESKLYEKIEEKKAIFGTTTSTGLIVKGANVAGIDFSVVHKESLYGIDARIPAVARIGYGGDCNEIMYDNADDLLRFAGELPVIVGVGAAEPYYNIELFTEKLLKKGFAGITHIPTSGGWVGDFGDSIGKAGCGYKREAELIKHFSDKDVFTVGYCFEEEQVRIMSQAGASVLAIYIPKLVDESYGWNILKTIDEAHDKAKKLVEVARKESPNNIILLTGGDPLGTEALQALLLESGAHGYLGDESLETQLVYNAVSTRISKLKQMR